MKQVNHRYTSAGNNKRSDKNKARKGRSLRGGNWEKSERNEGQTHALGSGVRWRWRKSTPAKETAAVNVQR